MGSPEENVEPLGLGSSLLSQKHWLPRPSLGFLSLGDTHPQTELPVCVCGGGDPFPEVTAGKREAWGWCCPQGASGGPASRGRCGLRHSSCAAGRVETGPASLASCLPSQSPHPSQACLPGTQHGLHFLPAFHPSPILLPSSESRSRRRNLYAHCADEETESYRGKKDWKGQ